MKLAGVEKTALSGDDKYMMKVIGIAAVIVVFCLASTKVLLSQASYKRHIINARHVAVKALEDDLAKSASLKSQYQVFEGTNPKNIIGGRNTTESGALPPDGNNSRIVLDALPSSYDFPALISSMAKILSSNGISSPTIGGTDQSDTISAGPSSTPAPVPIPLTISGTGTYATVQSLIKDLERSIRPFDITSLNIQGSETAMNFSTSLNTYFQPSKTLNITDKAVQ